MQTVLIVVSVLLIAIVLFQAGKAEGTGAILTGGNDSLFKNRKERGGELFVTRLTFVLGFIFLAISFIIGF